MLAISPSKRFAARIQAALGIDGWAIWLFVIVLAAMIAASMLHFAAQPYVWFSTKTGRCVAVEYGGSCSNLPATYRTVWMPDDAW